MSSLHETAYPRLRKTITEKELKEYYTPTPEELKLIASGKKTNLTHWPHPESEVISATRVLCATSFSSILDHEACA